MLYAPLLTAIQDRLSYQVRPTAPPPFGPVEPARITSIKADGEFLVIGYDYRNGQLRLRSVVDDNAIANRFQGIWDDDDGHGCAMLEMIKPGNFNLLVETLDKQTDLESVSLGIAYHKDELDADWPTSISLSRPHG